MAESILQFILSDLATWLVYIAIAGLFLVCIARCVLPVWESKRILRRAIRLVKKDDKEGSSVWQEESFLGRGALYAHWSEYLNNLFFADGAYHNPSNVEDYINEDTAIYGPGRSALSDAAPSLMVSLGFLGTLIGISQGLSGFSMDNISEVTAAIQKLIPNMQYAFNTSIVGVIGSILFTIINKNAQGAARRALLAFYAAMNKHAGIASVDPMTQIAIYQQEQTTILHELRKELKTQLAASVATAVEKSMQPLQGSIESFMAAATKEQLRGVDAIVTRFLEHMDDAMSGQFQNLAVAINTASRSQKELQQGLADSVVSVRSMVRELTDAHRVSGDLLTKFQAAITNATAMQEGSDALNRSLSQYIASASRLQAELSEAANGIHDAAKALTSGFSGSTQAMQESAALLNKNSAQLLSGISRDIDRTYNNFFERLNQATDSLAQVVSQVQNSIDALPAVLDDAASLYADEAKHLSDALRQTNDTLQQLRNL